MSSPTSLWHAYASVRFDQSVEPPVTREVSIAFVEALAQSNLTVPLVRSSRGRRRRGGGSSVSTRLSRSHPSRRGTRQLRKRFDRQRKERDMNRADMTIHTDVGTFVVRVVGDRFHVIRDGAFVAMFEERSLAVRYVLSTSIEEERFLRLAPEVPQA